METITINQDIPIIYLNALSFPEGIQAAHEQLQTIVPLTEQRIKFGLSRPENNDKIVYKAALQELIVGEAARLNLQSMFISKGSYYCITIENYNENLTKIGEAFYKLTAMPDIDPQGYCVEEYVNEQEMKCLIKIA